MINGKEKESLFQFCDLNLTNSAFAVSYTPFSSKSHILLIQPNKSSTAILFMWNTNSCIVSSATLFRALWYWRVFHVIGGLPVLQEIVPLLCNVQHVHCLESHCIMRLAHLSLALHLIAQNLSRWSHSMQADSGECNELWLNAVQFIDTK